MRAQDEMKVEKSQGYGLGIGSEYFFLEGFVEPLVLL